jgi:hypothetical protein
MAFVFRLLEIDMNLPRATFMIVGLAAITAASPAFSQQAATPAPASAAAAPVSAPDSDPAFMTGLRRVGVMAGEVVQCTAEADRQAPIAEAMQLSNEIALHFGLAAAFNFSAAVGYGAGKPFDKAGCADATTGWNGIKQKYLGQ